MLSLPILSIPSAPSIFKPNQPNNHLLTIVLDEVKHEGIVLLVADPLCDNFITDTFTQSSNYGPPNFGMYRLKKEHQPLMIPPLPGRNYLTNKDIKS